MQDTKHLQCIKLLFFLFSLRRRLSDIELEYIENMSRISSLFQQNTF